MRIKASITPRRSSSCKALANNFMLTMDHKIELWAFLIESKIINATRGSVYEIFNGLEAVVADLHQRCDWSRL